MNRFFSGDNVLFRFTGNVLDVVVLSLLWLVCCVPIVTILPATAALYYSCVKCIRFREPGPYGSFFQSFRENLRCGIPGSVVFVAVGLVLWLGLRGLDAAAPAGPVGVVLVVAYICLCLVPMGVFVVCAALLSRFSYTPGGLLADSLRLTLRHLLRLLPAAFLWGGTLVLCVRYFFYMVWMVLPALCALAASRFLEPVLRKYTPMEEGIEDLPPEERPWYLR